MKKRSLINDVKERRIGDVIECDRLYTYKCLNGSWLNTWEMWKLKNILKIAAVLNDGIVIDVIFQIMNIFQDY